ncbi:hypothetical protein NCG89_00855 [Spongiibacter taiwanensis]|uniref:hypothetical protein n=1 Tax=Spongiibacter taiwanensis TaxID=1748242 RepID=UPI002034AAA1|nr:hypothetical protein [Spongiibacter taiwanensis]USA43352.1 hypothetical protein NCG89_00855 [Spongiibacter taiwanensis]
MSNVLPFSPETTVSNAAMSYVLAHRNQHLASREGNEALVSRCQAHLMMAFDITADRAQKEAALALAEASHTGEVWLDAEATTAFYTTLRTKDGRQIIVSADQILHAITDFFSLQ